MSAEPSPGERGLTVTYVPRVGLSTGRIRIGDAVYKAQARRRGIEPGREVVVTGRSLFGLMVDEPDGRTVYPVPPRPRSPGPEMPPATARLPEPDGGPPPGWLAAGVLGLLFMAVGCLTPLVHTDTDVGTALENPAFGPVLLAAAAAGMVLLLTRQSAVLLALLAGAAALTLYHFFATSAALREADRMRQLFPLGGQAGRFALGWGWLVLLAGEGLALLAAFMLPPVRTEPGPTTRS